MNEKRYTEGLYETNRKFKQEKKFLSRKCKCQTRCITTTTMDNRIFVKKLYVVMINLFQKK